jgi:hypothetical protein
MPKGKAAGERCIQLDEKNLCRLFGKPERPAVCLAFQPCRSICGETDQQALFNLQQLETLTR